MDKKRHISLKAAITLLSGICLAFFTCAFFLIFYRTMPDMLMNIENQYLQAQTNYLVDRFNDIQYNLESSALDIGTRNQSRLFAAGNNPDYLRNAWGGIDPTQLFNYNMIIVSDVNGNILYSDYYDYIDGTDIIPPSELVDRLSEISLKVIEKNQTAYPQNTPISDIGVSGLMFYDSVPYYTSAMPIMDSRISGNAIGSVTLGIIVDDRYFHTLSKFDGLTFSWKHTSVYDQQQKGDISLDGPRFNVASEPIRDIYGTPVQLFISGTRTIYTHGLKNINTAGSLMFLVSMLVAASLYLIIDYMFLRPMRRLNTGISNIGSAGNRLDVHELKTLEFARVTEAINDMVDRLNHSKTMQSVLDGIDYFIYVTDPVTDELLFINKKMTEHLNLPEDALGQTCWKLFRKDKKARCDFCPLYKLNDNFPGPIEWEEQTNGRYYKKVDSLIEWVDGRTVHIQYSMDVTNEKEHALLLEELKNQAEQASRAKSDFLSNMSHEMRTPMNAVIGMTHIARASSDIKRKEYCLAKIDEASNHLLGVINDVLDVSKIEAGKFELSISEFDFERMVRRVADVVNFRVDEKKQRFTVKIEPDVPASIICDEQRLSQVLTNLLSNAVKFTPERGHVSLFIRVMEKSDNGYDTIRVRVTDTGIGISEEQQARLFSSFEQADENISSKYGGTGLGLVISKSIVEMMGGKIWIESELGKGAAFVFDIRVKVGSKKYELIRTIKENTKVLVVDNSKEEREYFKDTAIYLDFACDTAESAEEAVSMIERDRDNPYDMVFVDWYMPYADDTLFALKLRDIYPEGRIIVMISINQWDKVEKEALAAGVTGYIQKPLFPAVVLDCMNAWLSDTSDTDAENEQDSDIDCFKGHRVLLAEDVEINREIVAALLEFSGLDIEFAENGAVAVEKFVNDPTGFDMILMDIHMPEMDGLEATRRIRALNIPKAAEIPIVAMTANVFREDIEKCLNAGMNDHLGKPIDLDELMKKLRKYILGKE